MNDEITKLKRELNYNIRVYGIGSTEALLKSQELDKLIFLKTKELMKNEK